VHKARGSDEAPARRHPRVQQVPESCVSCCGVPPAAEHREELHPAPGESGVHERLPVRRPAHSAVGFIGTRSPCARWPRCSPRSRVRVAPRRDLLERNVVAHRRPRRPHGVVDLRWGAAGARLPTARPVAVSIVTTYGYDTPQRLPSPMTRRGVGPSRDPVGRPASQPKSVSLISEGSRAGAPTRRSQMSSELPGARYDATGVSRGASGRRPSDRAETRRAESPRGIRDQRVERADRSSARVHVHGSAVPIDRPIDPPPVTVHKADLPAVGAPRRDLCPRITSRTVPRRSEPRPPTPPPRRASIQVT